ncbi:MAG: TonB family protein [Chitinophagaceae bacterium]|nr:TonB family protein [Chitinophagaceae bacterium]HQV60991.1 TonB family protein [Chitinophagaceae bacterium]HQV84863.1 TonB family protein [Chitinophagaceae bacterium]HQX72286.1 TonB family protein [Chitinophagaceae bacterium]HQZ74809.1 TonB family protein [Chitinophagaceae bacterium]
MTNKEILQASLLDIVFDKRNKAYGAYALRKGYNARLLTALAAGMSVILLFIFINGMQGSKNSSFITSNKNEGIVIKQIELPKDKPAEPEKPKEVIKQKPVEKIATAKYISNIKIEKDVKSAMTAIGDLDGKAIDSKEGDGKIDDGTEIVNVDPVAPVGNGAIPAEPKQPDFVIQERNPEFPGGAEALKRFLSKNLDTPGELEAGEMKTVKIRFKVDKDGSVNTFEIVTSAGNDFDHEVVRVCKKMPKWVPAIQNGVNVPVNYVLPVIFVGSE